MTADPSSSAAPTLVTIEVRHNDDEGGYIATSVDTIGCLGEGETVADAIENFSEKLRDWAVDEAVRQVRHG